MLLRTLALFPLLALLYFSQRHWAVRVWRLTGRVSHPAGRVLIRAFLVIVWGSLVMMGAAWLLRILPQSLRSSAWVGVAGLWLSSALFAWIAVKCVHGVEWLWNRRTRRKQSVEADPQIAPESAHAPSNPSRRYFFQTAGYFAGAVPFVGALYGFAVERLHFRVERVEVPIAGLSPELDGLRIVQLSDIHMGGYFPGDQLRRAVAMANELGAELAVVTGDFISWRGDPIVGCVEGLAALRAPLGVWGCNGNHETYAGYQELAAWLFQQAGMRMLRLQNSELSWRGAKFNLLGVDHQTTRGFNPRRWRMLEGVEPLLRPGMPNILLSHSPNAFYRAAELGVDLTISGHTHGGQIQVEIIDPHLNPARFMTRFTAGLYSRPAGVPLTTESNSMDAPGNRVAHLYVNRGLGTIATPIRIGSSPEITLLTLRRV
jgi:predicted MPP superfamily phosphohydrolase